MAIIRMREVIAVARTGETFIGPEGYTWELSLASLYAMTEPADWEPELVTVGDWELGVHDLTREAAEQVTTQLNNSQPWEQ